MFTSLLYKLFKICFTAVDLILIFNIYYLFSHPATSLTRPVVMYTVLACRCGAPCQWGYAFGWDVPGLQCLQHNGWTSWTDLSCRARGCCHGKVKGLLAGLGLEDLDIILREKVSLVWACGAFWCCSLYRLMTGGDREAQVKMEEIDGERLP